MKGWWVETNNSSEKDCVIDNVDLTVWSNIWRGPVAHTLNVQVFLIFIELLKVIPVSINHAKHNNFIARNLNAYSNWWLESKEFDILCIKIFKF